MACFTNRPEPELRAGEMAVLLPRIPLSVVRTVGREPTCDCRRNNLLWIDPVQPECMAGLTSRIIPSVAQEEGLYLLDSRTQIPKEHEKSPATCYWKEASLLSPIGVNRWALFYLWSCWLPSVASCTHPEKAGSRTQDAERRIGAKTILSPKLETQPYFFPL